MKAIPPLTITKGIPLPPKHPRVKYPFAAMEIGDAFDVAPVHPDDLAKARHRIGVAAATAGRRLKRRFISRSIPQPDGTIVMRVWRLS